MASETASPSGVRGDGPGLLRAIEARLPDLRLLADPVDRESYRRDETAYYEADLPLAVALPTETAQVVALVRLCGEFDVPIVPRGAGTGLSGAAAGIEGALTIAFTRMDRILEIDAGNLTVTTQPGIINARLKAAVAEQGLSYAPDPASYEQCTIGGNLGTNAGGCAASSTASPGTPSSGSRSCSPTARSCDWGARTSRTSPGTG